jgi:hypothetical protein
MQVVPLDAPVPGWPPGGSYGHPPASLLLICPVAGPPVARWWFGLRDGPLIGVGPSRRSATTVVRCAQSPGSIIGPGGAAGATGNALRTAKRLWIGPRVARREPVIEVILNPTTTPDQSGYFNCPTGATGVTLT